MSQNVEIRDMWGSGPTCGKLSWGRETCPLWVAPFFGWDPQPYKKRKVAEKHTFTLPCVLLQAVPPWLSCHGRLCLEVSWNKFEVIFVWVLYHSRQLRCALFLLVFLQISLPFPNILASGAFLMKLLELLCGLSSIIKMEMRAPSSQLEVSLLQPFNSSLSTADTPSWMSKRPSYLILFIFLLLAPMVIKVFPCLAHKRHAIHGSWRHIVL